MARPRKIVQTTDTTEIPEVSGKLTRQEVEAIQKKARGKPGEPVTPSRADFSGADIAGVDLSRLDLRASDFIGANLAGVDFTGANLQGCNFDGAILEGAIFTNADISFSTGIK